MHKYKDSEAKDGLILENTTKKRSVNSLPEGGVSVNNTYKNTDNTDVIDDSLTKEWIITYANKDKYWHDMIFLVHSKTIEGAFDHFIDIKPDTVVKQVKYYGIYF